MRKYNLDTSFYSKYTSAYGVPILANYVVDDRFVGMKLNNFLKSDLFYIQSIEKSLLYC